MSESCRSPFENHLQTCQFLWIQCYYGFQNVISTCLREAGKKKWSRPPLLFQENCNYLRFFCCLMHNEIMLQSATFYAWTVSFSWSASHESKRIFWCQYDYFYYCGPSCYISSILSTYILLRKNYILSYFIGLILKIALTFRSKLSGKSSL